MATIATQSVSETGTVITFTTLSATSNDFSNTGKELIYYKNGSGGSITLSVTAQTTSVASPTYGDLTKANAAITVEAGAVVLIGPFAVASFNDVDGMCTFTTTSATDMEVAIFYQS